MMSSKTSWKEVASGVKRGRPLFRGLDKGRDAKKSDQNNESMHKTPEQEQN